MTRCLLVGPYRQVFESRFTSMPLGIVRIASWLNSHGHYADVYDININDKSLEEVIENGNYDIIGFSPLHCTLEYDLGAINMAKNLSSKSLIVAGGVEATLNYQQILDNSPCDVVVLAEGEEPMLALCNKQPVESIPGIIYRNYAKPITEEKLWEYDKNIDYESMRYKDYWDQTRGLYPDPNETEIKTAHIFSMSHCPMNCTFCSVRKYHNSACGKHVNSVKLNAQQVVCCVEKIEKAYPDVKTIFFVEDNFCMDKKRVFEFCELVKDKGLTYICLARIDSIEKEMVKAMAEAGFRVLSFGTESLSQHVCDGLNKHQDCSLIAPAAEMCLEYGIKPYMTLIVFTVEGTLDDLLTDYYGFRRLLKKGVGISIEPYIMPLHGSSLYEQTDNSFQHMLFDIPGTNKKIRKPVAAYPKDHKVRAVMDEFKEIFYKRRKEEAKNVGHKEKQFQAKVILDVVGEILKKRGYIQ